MWRLHHLATERVDRLREQDAAVSAHDQPAGGVIAVVRFTFAGLSLGLALSGVILAFAATGPLWAKILSGAILSLISVASLAYAIGFHAGVRSTRTRR